MLDGFGQAPVCIELDLDSYDGPWTHVERFRGRSGWLTVAEAELTTAGAGWTTTLVAACDDYGEAVPHFMAPNLLACACSHPQPCREFPPDELDELLAEAAHELRLGWVRENHRGLLNLACAGAERVAALEVAARAAVDEADRRIGDLRRRRRMPGVSPHAIGIFNEAIVSVEIDREAALHRLADERDRVRRAIASDELALLRRSNVTVTWEIMYHVSWSAAGRIGEDELAARDHITNARYRGGDFAYNDRQGRREDAVAVASMRAWRSKQAADHKPTDAEGVNAGEGPDKRAASGIGALPASADNATSASLKPIVDDDQEPVRKLVRRVRTLVAQVNALHSNRLPIARGYLIRMVGLGREVAAMQSQPASAGEERVAQHAALSDAARQLGRVEAMIAERRPGTAKPSISMPTTARAASPATPGSVASAQVAAPTPAIKLTAAAMVTTPPAANGKLTIERDLLARQLVELEIAGRKFLQGSPKFERNRAERAELTRRIAALNIGAAQAEAAAAEPSLEEQRSELQAELRRHEQRGAKLSDGVSRYGRYRDGRLALLGRIAEIEGRIARKTRREERV